MNREEIIARLRGMMVRRCSVREREATHGLAATPIS